MEEKNKETQSKIVMSREVAEKELEKWFDYRKVKQRARENINEELGFDPAKEDIIEAFMHGVISFDEENGILTQKLEYPLKKETSGEIILSELNWKPRIKDREIDEHMVGVSPKDRKKIMRAYIAAYTDTNKGQIGSLDSYSDAGLAQTVVGYFL